jgi:hypothetical protein
MTLAAGSVAPCRAPAVKPHHAQGKKGSTMPTRAGEMAYTTGQPFIVTINISDAPNTQVQSSAFAVDGGAPIVWKSPNGFAPFTYILGDITLLSVVIIPHGRGQDPGVLTITFTDPDLTPVRIVVVPNGPPCCSFCAKKPSAQE